MPYFNILQIITDGDVENPMVIGQHQENFGVSNVGMEKYSDDAHYIVTLDYERYANGKFLFRLKVTTKWLIVKLGQEEKEKAKAFVRHLLIRSISIFHGVMDEKLRANKWVTKLPDDPDLKTPIELTNDLVDNYFKQ